MLRAPLEHHPKSAVGYGSADTGSSYWPASSPIILIMHVLGMKEDTTLKFLLSSNSEHMWVMLQHERRPDFKSVSEAWEGWEHRNAREKKNCKSTFPFPTLLMPSLLCFRIQHLSKEKSQEASGQDGRVGKHCTCLLPWPLQNYTKWQNNHHWEPPAVCLNRSPVTKGIQKKPHWDW